MKNILTLAFALSILSVQTKAQECLDLRDKLSFGIKAGANYSNVYDTQGEDFVAKAKTGFAAGAFLSIPIGRILGIQPEIMFSQRGFTATGEILGSDYAVTRTTDWIDVPLLVQLKLSPYITLLFGPQYSYLIKQTDGFTNGVTSVIQQQTFENDNLRKNLVCFTGGLDINIQHFVFGGRVGWDLQNNNGDGTSSTPRYKNEWYQLSIGLRL